MNTNPKARRILCFGDSLTWGYNPGTDHERLLANKRWTGIIQDNLGDSYEIIEEGLNSRTLTEEDLRPGKQGRSGKIYLLPCLDTHDPIDLVILGIGANEMKDKYGKNAEEIGKTLEKEFVEIILSHKSQSSEKTPKIIIMSPPLINLNIEYARERFAASREKNLAIGRIYEEIAKRNNCGFVDLSRIAEVGKDGLHFDEENNFKLAMALIPEIKKILG